MLVWNELVLWDLRVDVTVDCHVVEGGGFVEDELDQTTDSYEVKVEGCPEGDHVDVEDGGSVEVELVQIAELYEVTVEG